MCVCSSVCERENNNLQISIHVVCFKWACCDVKSTDTVLLGQYCLVSGYPLSHQ